MNKPFLINGEWKTADETSAVRSPFDGRELSHVSLVNKSGLQEAIGSAHNRFQTTRRGSAEERTALLEAVAEQLHRRAGEFVELIVAEAGKPVALAEAEVSRAELTFRFAAREAATAAGAFLPIDASAPGQGHFGCFRRMPIGVILAITPFNFPLNLVAHKVAPALATGNTVVLKPALKTPLTSLLLGEVLTEASMPPGQVNVTPFSHDLMPAALEDPRIKMISFTGSAPVGWRLKQQAGTRKVALELGGNAGLIIHSDSEWRSKLPLIASGAYGYAGQSCISVQRIFVQETIYAEFRDAFAAYVSANIKYGDPTRRDVLVGPMINHEALEKVLEWLDEAENLGGRLLTPRVVEGNVLGPILLENVPTGARVVCEEAFAPLAVLEPYGSFEQALGKVNASRYGLQAGVFTRDLKLAWQAFEELEVGGVLINQVPTFRVENMPYGGVKESGFGREGVRYAMEEMTEVRNWIVNLS